MYNLRARTPSVGSSCRPRSCDLVRQVGSVAFVITSAPLPRTLSSVPSCSPSSKVGSSTWTISRPVSRELPHVRPGSEKDASLRLLQPTHDTSTLLAVRIPLAASISLRPPDLATARPSFNLFLPRSTCPVRPYPRPGSRLGSFTPSLADESPGGASLDGEPPASASPQPPVGLRDDSLEDLLDGHRVVLVGPRSKAPPRRASRRWCCPPRRACSSASDVLCRRCPARVNFRSRRAHTRQTLAPPRPRQRPRLHLDQDAFRRRVPSPPHRRACPAFCLAASAVHPLRPETVVSAPSPFVSSGCPRRHLRKKARDPRGSATAPVTSPPRTGFERRLCPPGCPGWLGYPLSTEGALRARRFSSTSAIRTAREHNHASIDPGPTSPTGRTQLALGWEQAPDGVGAPSTGSTVLP